MYIFSVDNEILKYDAGKELHVSKANGTFNKDRVVPVYLVQFSVMANSQLISFSVERLKKISIKLKHLRIEMQCSLYLFQKSTFLLVELCMNFPPSLEK